MQKNRFFYLPIIFVGFTISNAMNHDFQKNPETLKPELSRVGRHSLGVLLAGMGIAALMSSPQNDFLTNMIYSATGFFSLRTFFKDVSSLRPLQNKITLGLIGASLVASQTRDMHRNILDHIRALCAGGLLTTGLCESIKKVVRHDIKGTCIAAGIFAAGVLLLSQKDIKTFFGYQKGYSLNPPSDVKKLIRSLGNNNRRSFQIDRITLQAAKEGKVEALPFISRIFTSFEKKNGDQTPRSILVSELELVEDILPYFRTETEPTQIPDDSLVHLVFSVNSKKTVGLSPQLARDYLTLNAYSALLG